MQLDAQCCRNKSSYGSPVVTANGYQRLCDNTRATRLPSGIVQRRIHPPQAATYTPTFAVSVLKRLLMETLVVFLSAVFTSMWMAYVSSGLTNTCRGHHNTCHTLNSDASDIRGVSIASSHAKSTHAIIVRYL